MARKIAFFDIDGTLTSVQRLPHPGIHPIYNHQTQTLLHMPARFC